MILRARAVVTMDGAPIEDGAVAIEGNRISDVGPWADVRARVSGEIIDLGEKVLLPGLINAHCHLDYTLLRGAIPAQASFTGWIQSINERKGEFGAEDYVRSIEAGFLEAAQFGTTTIANLEAFPEVIGQITDTPLRTWWFAEMIDVRAAGVGVGCSVEATDGVGETWRFAGWNRSRAARAVHCFGETLRGNCGAGRCAEHSRDDASGRIEGRDGDVSVEAAGRCSTS